jgi:hypothetical protein
LIGELTHWEKWISCPRSTTAAAKKVSKQNIRKRKKDVFTSAPFE